MARNRELLLRKAEAAIILRKRKAQESFWAFCLYKDPEFFAKRIFLKKIADAFQRLFERYSKGETWSLAVSMPPRAGKSYITSLFIAWMLGHFPEESVMRNCCSDTLYNKLSYDTRDIIRSKMYNEIFPDALLRGDKQNVKGWSLTEARQVSYFGAGVGGTVIGFGASMLAVTDDLYKSLEDALSETNNEKVWSWKQGTHDSRFEKNCCRIDIGTRWSSNDVLGRMEEAGKYDEIIRIAALDENDESFCPDVHTTEYYRDLRLETDDSIWFAEYQQEPIEAKGLLFPPSELQYFKRKDIEGKTPDGSMGACDVADKGNDDLCAPFAKVFGDILYIDDVVFTKEPVEVTEPLVSQAILDNKCDQVRIESNNGGRIFAINVRKEVNRHTSRCLIQARATTKNKETRIIMRSGWIKKHCRFLDKSEYKKGSHYYMFMKMLTKYMREGGNEHDDAPDGLTILAEFADSLGMNTKHQVRGVGRGHFQQ